MNVLSRLAHWTRTRTKCIRLHHWLWALRSSSHNWQECERRRFML